MIAITEFKLSDDLASITLKATSDSTEITNIRIYVGENYLTSTYYDVPVQGGYSYDGVIYATQLGVTAPLTDIYIAYIDNRSNETVEAGIWSLEAPSQCLANKVLAYPNGCADCKGLSDINIMYMNIESTIMFLALKEFEKALKTLSVVKLMCPDYGDFSITSTGDVCPGGIGCWIIEDDFIVQ